MLEAVGRSSSIFTLSQSKHIPLRSVLVSSFSVRSGSPVKYLLSLFPHPLSTSKRSLSSYPTCKDCPFLVALFCLATVEPPVYFAQAEVFTRRFRRRFLYSLEGGDPPSFPFLATFPRPIFLCLPQGVVIAARSRHVRFPGSLSCFNPATRIVPLIERSPMLGLQKFSVSSLQNQVVIPPPFFARFLERVIIMIFRHSTRKQVNFSLPYVRGGILFSFSKNVYDPYL